MFARRMNRTPNYTQRLSSATRRPFVPLSVRYHFDYMGNSYFEGGETARTIRNMHDNHGMFEFDLHCWRVIVIFNADHYTMEGAEKIIRDMYVGQIWQEERTNFNAEYLVANLGRDGRIPPNADRDTTNAWLEIERGLFWTVEKCNPADLLQNFKHHVQFLDYRRRQKELGLPDILHRDEYNHKVHTVESLAMDPLRAKLISDGRLRPRPGAVVIGHD